MTDNVAKELQATSNILGQMAERARVLAWIEHNQGSYRKGTKERQVLEILFKQVQGGEQPPQVRML